MTRLNLPVEDVYVGEVIRGYTLIKEIGRGNNGVVYSARDEFVDHTVACKLIPKSNLRESWEIEIRKANKLTGINEVAAYMAHGSIKLDNNEYIFVFWEYIEGKDIRKIIREDPSTITLEVIKSIVEQLLNVFYAMKVRRITHGDLHLGNILLSYDDRLIEQIARIKITDFGFGCSCNNLTPKDDYIGLAEICHELLQLIEPSELSDGKIRYFYDNFLDDFIPKKLLEMDPTTSNFVRRPEELLKILKGIDQSYSSLSERKEELLLNPFDYLRCEQIGNSFKLLQNLYSKNFPGYNDFLRRNNTILTGPRGCGKTTILKNLSLKTQLLAGNFDGLNDNYIGIYYHCYDLHFTFPYLPSNLNSDKRRGIIHYFNLSILYEIVDLLDIIATKREDLIEEEEILGFQNFVKEHFIGFSPPPHGTNILKHLKEVIIVHKRELKKWFNKPRGTEKPEFLGLDFIKELSVFLNQHVGFCKGKPIYYLLDDYSLPIISEPIQSTLNDFILFPSEGSEHFYKISTESIVTFHQYSTTKQLVENREYVVVDLGKLFLLEKSDTISQFLSDIINNRLKHSSGIHPRYHDIRPILGDSPYKSNNDLALNIRNASGDAPRERVLYSGWQTIVNLCSGDVANILEIIKSMFTPFGADAFGREDGISIPLSYQESDKQKNTHLQDKAIREAGTTFLQQIDTINEKDFGTQLRQITESFGYVAHYYLMYVNTRNVNSAPPHQAFRIELQENPSLDEKTMDLYNNLIRYGIFFVDKRGKSQRGHVVHRLYLRPLLIPTFKLTFSKRDSVRLDPNDFTLLLKDPEGFKLKMINSIDMRAMKSISDLKQTRLLDE